MFKMVELLQTCVLCNDIKTAYYVFQNVFQVLFSVLICQVSKRSILGWSVQSFFFSLDLISLGSASSEVFWLHVQKVARKGEAN